MNKPQEQHGPGDKSTTVGRTQKPGATDSAAIAATSAKPTAAFSGPYKPVAGKDEENNRLSAAKGDDDLMSQEPPKPKQQKQTLQQAKPKQSAQDKSPVKKRKFI